MEQKVDWADNLKKVAISVVLLGGAAAGLYYFISSRKKDQSEKKTNEKSHLPGEPENYAAKLLKSLAPNDYFSFSVDKEQVKLALREVAKKGIYTQVQQAYSDLTRGEHDLDADLRKRLTQQENDLITLMIKSGNGK